MAQMARNVKIMPLQVALFMRKTACAIV